MRILILDCDGVGLAFAMRCNDAGHQTQLWIPKGKNDWIGQGLVDRPADWRGPIEHSDLIVLTDNCKLRKELKPYFAAGYPIFGANDLGAELELDRQCGQHCMEQYGILTLPCEEFTDLDKAISFVEKTGKAYACKPWGGESDKALSFVADSPEDLIFTLRRWKREGKKGNFVLQEKVEGIEMGVGGWFGPGGWSQWIEENWEEKKLMNDGYGQNTGEMGTTLRYTRDSKLFRETLEPLTPYLEEIGYVGNVDSNCIIDDQGQAWPLELTMRLGWPAFNICMALHQGDPANWMRGLLEGRDTLQVQEGVAVGVVLAHGDFPWSDQSKEETSGYPLRGITQFNLPHLAMQSVMWGEAPVKLGSKIRQENTFVTAGDYILVATGVGWSVSGARSAAYDVAKAVKLPSNKMMRTDIGARLEKQLPLLQMHGYATGMNYD